MRVLALNNPHKLLHNPEVTGSIPVLATHSDRFLALLKKFVPETVPNKVSLSGTVFFCSMTMVKTVKYHYTKQPRLIHYDYDMSRDWYVEVYL